MIGLEQECPLCDRILNFCQVECENHKKGECTKCNRLRAETAIRNGVLDDHSIYELEFLGVNLRFLYAVEKTLNIFFLGQLVEVPSDDLKDIPNTGPKFRDQLRKGLNRYYELAEHLQERDAALAKAKDDYDDRYRYGGEELPH